jgi:hypothetical protein
MRALDLCLQSAAGWLGMRVVGSPAIARAKAGSADVIQKLA